MRRRIFLSLPVIYFSSMIVFAQDITATIRGTVKDDFGRPIIEATVTVKNETDKVVTTVTTDVEGVYQVKDLSTGSYKLIVESKDGVKSEEVTDINLTVAAEQVFDLKLKTSLEGKAVRKIQPTYPEVAKIAQQQGRVVVGVLVKPDGKVEKVIFLSGNAAFRSAALEAAQQWIFQKSLNGYSGRLAFNFSLKN